jgi:hypothetical protein
MGSGSSSGGSSGEVDYPEYMKKFHENMLGDGNAGSDITNVIDNLLGNSPYSGEAAFDPTTALDATDTAICAFDTVVDALGHETDWQSAIINAASVIDSNILDTTYFDDDIDGYAQLLDDEIESKIIPKFEAGMRDANAVMTSAFVIGRALIWDGRDRELGKYATEVRSKMHLYRNDMIIKSVERILTSLMYRVDFEKAVATLTSDANRIRIVAEKEEMDQNLAIAEGDARWDVELFTHAGNLLASIGGGTVSSQKGQKNSLQSALSGGLSGAAMGAQFGAGGAIAGGIIGIGASLLG